MHWRQQLTCMKLEVSVRVAAVIRTSMTRINSKATSPSTANASFSGGGVVACKRANKPHSGLSSIFIINLLFLLLLSLCCDVCKSNEFPLTSNNGSVSESHSTTNSSPSASLSAALDAINQQNPYSTTLSVAGTSNDATVAAITRECLEHCQAEQDIFSNEYGLNCKANATDEFCFTPRCSKGCEQWWRALNELEPCPKACMSTLQQLVDLPCISACERAQRRYWQRRRPQMERELHTTAPKLLSDNATTDALTLQWDIHLPDTYLAHYPFVIQFQYVDGNELRDRNANNNNDGDNVLRWQRLTDYNCNENFACEIRDGLMPYTDYRFRFELRFGDAIDEVLYSLPTAVHRTAAQGAPISAPLLQSAFALDANHVCVFWQPGKFTNGPLTGYKLTIKSVDNEMDTLLAPDVHDYVFHGLNPGSNYALHIAMTNEEGIGPPVKTVVTTKELEKPVDHFDGFNWLLVAGEYSIKLKNLEPLSATKLIFIGDNLISDYDLFASEQRLFVVDVESTVWSTLVNDDIGKNTISLKEPLDGFKALKISVDWLNKRLVFAGQLRPKSWAIVTTDFDGSSAEILAQNLSAPIEQLQVDPINGWLFWNHNSALMRMNLANNAITVLPLDVEIDVGYFRNDFKRHMLLAYGRRHNELFELSYFGAFARSLRLNGSWVLQGELQSFWHIGSSILATNGTHLMRQDFETNENDLWSIREVEWCSSVFPLLPKYNVQPQPMASGRPEHLHAVLGVSSATITWSAPPRNAFQTANAWQRWQYELEIMDVVSNSAFNIRNIKTTYFDVEKLQANNFYKLRVRAAGPNGEAGEWSDELLSRTWPLGDHRFLLAGADGLYESRESGDHLQPIDAAPSVREFVQVNGSMYYIAADKQLRCVNIVHPELNCSFAVADAVSVAYEWRGGKLYWADVLKNCVVSSNADGSERELLPVFGAQHIRVDSHGGHLYYTTGARLARRLLSGGEETAEEEYFDVGGLGAQIRGFAMDLARQQVYWVVRQQDGEVRLCRAALAHQRKGAEKVLPHDIVFGSLQYLADIDSLLWLVAHSSRIVLTRVDAWSDETWIEWPQLKQLNYVQLRRDYMPPADWSVIPAAINASSVRLEYAYNDEITVTWNPSSTADNYTVFYRAMMQQDTQRVPRLELALPSVRLGGMREPLNVSVTPYTAWSMGATVNVLLSSVKGAPLQPKRLRVHVQRLDVPLLKPNVSVLVRWDAPQNVLENTLLSYTVYCWLGDELVAQRMYIHSAQEALLQVAFDELHVGETYRFQVQAFAGARTGAGSKSAFHEWHIDPEVQSLPRILYATSEYIAELDLDLNSSEILVHTSSEVEHLVALQGEARLLWVNDNVELLSFVRGSKPVKLARMRAEVLSLTVDWVQRIVYWAEMDTHEEHTVSIYQLDLCQFEGRVMLPSKLFTIESGYTIKDLIVLPYSKVLLWLQLELGQVNGTLAGRNLSDFSALQLVSEARNVRLFAGYSTAELETVNIVDFLGKTYAYDVHRKLYSALKMQFDLTDAGLKHIDRDAGYIYSLSNYTVRAYNRRKQQLEFESYVSNSRYIRAYNYQPYPERKCLLPQKAAVLHNKTLPGISVKAHGEYFLSLEFPALSSIVHCALETPGVKYTVLFRDWSDNAMRNYTTQQRTLNITQLQPFSNYSLQLVVSSYYQKKLKLPPLYSKVTTVRTAVSAPSAPRNFTGYALSPTQIYVSWEAPEQLNAEQVWYQLHWQAEDSELGAHMRLNQTAVTLLQLDAAQRYTIWLKVFSADDKFNTTSPITLQTFKAPSALLMVAVTAYNFTLSWPLTPNATKVILVCRDLHGADEVGLDITENAAHINVPNLVPKTKYEFFFQVYYGTDMDPYIWPELQSDRFVYETLGDAPSAPGRPLVEHITGEIFKVFWESARNNGEPVIEYSMEALQARYPRRFKRDDQRNDTNATKMMQSQLLWAEELNPVEDTWVVYCNTSEHSCIVRELHTMRLLKFRVRARNEPYGWGPYSQESERVSEPFVSPEKRDSLVLAIITPAAVVSSCVVIVVILRIVHVRRQKAKKLLEKSRPSIWSNVSALHQQQMMAARNRAFSMTSNSTMYTGGPLSDADIALLPHIHRSQITLLNFLGSGAFGEVFEGWLKHADEEEPEKVAIKTLRKGASEFAELLQEAQLMSNFRHENIVRLIGVCLDVESISIIMEHMEGGDLLSYLRETRPGSNQSFASLQLLDLIGMCIDVATGCSYLEDMHFVHRDLACRNCLVSSRMPSKRVVKIGDFGLARDIYRNDYYRKEGEGLLPVRWMSPESLADGVFTTQSDVWAFGVLCWEILTLGQQPYVARNNFEVLNYVKEGGRLEQPDNCPDTLFVLLSQCWSTDPDERPSFRRCLNTMLTIKTSVRRVSLGFHVDDANCVVYANNNGVAFNSFLAGPLPKVEEEADTRESTCCLVTASDGGSAKIHFEQFYKDVDIETASEDSVLEADEEPKHEQPMSCNDTEGISRL